MTFPSATDGAPGETVMASLATNAVRTRLALTTFLSNGGEHRLSHVRVLLREVIHSAHECGMDELVNALATCEAMLSMEGSVPTTHARALDGALRALAPRPARPAPVESRIFDEGAAAAPRSLGLAVEAAAPAPAPAPALKTELGSPLELVLLATECASSAAASRAEPGAAPVDVEDEPAFDVDGSDTDVDDAPVFEREVSKPLRRASLLLSLTPPPASALLHPIASPITLTPPPNDDLALVVAASVAALQPELSPEPITAVIVPKPASYAHQAAFVSPEVLQQLMENDVLLAAPPGRARERDEHAASLVTPSPFQQVRAAYVVIAVLLGLLIGFVARTMVTAGVVGQLAPALLLVTGAPR